MTYIDRNDRSKEAILSNPPLSPLISLPDTTSPHITQITQLHMKTEQHPTINESSVPPLPNLKSRKTECSTQHHTAIFRILVFFYFRF